MSCTPNPCPQPGPTCDNPVVVTLVTPYTDVNTTCGMGNDYSNTCLGNYDGGEDIIYKLIVTAPACLDITVTGATPADKWIGLLVDDACPPNPTACLYSGNSGSGYTVTLGSVYLAPGVYCIMVDTWPQPNCIDFTLTITDCPGACCLPDGSCVPSTTPAACAAQGGDFQGPGTDCGPWSYTAVPCSNPLEDIAATGTHIPQAEVNDGGAPVNLPFTFSFFGVPQTSIGVSSNGYLTFGTMYGAYTPAPIPSAAPPNDLLAVLWRDLNATRPPAGGFSSRGMRPLIRPPSTPRAAPRAARSVPSRTARGS